jgi:hypothetical protein
LSTSLRRSAATSSSLPDVVIDAALLHECLALSIDDALQARIESALAEVSVSVRGLKPEALRTPAARLARDLLVRSGDRQGRASLDRRGDVFSSADARPGARLDGLEVLFGTMYAQSAYGFDDGPRAAPGTACSCRRWTRRGTMASCGVVGAAPAPPPRVSRLQTTAWMLLAWKAPATPFFHPVPMRSAATDADDAANERRRPLTLQDVPVASAKRAIR